MGTTMRQSYKTDEESRGHVPHWVIYHFDVKDVIAYFVGISFITIVFLLYSHTSDTSLLTGRCKSRPWWQKRFTTDQLAFCLMKRRSLSLKVSPRKL